MNESSTGNLESKVAVARDIVDRLVCIATGLESPEWMQKFRRVKNALAEQRLKDAIHEEARLTSLCSNAKWVVSGELAKRLEKAMGVLSRQVHYPGHSEPTFDPGEHPWDATALGTIADDRRYKMQRAADSFQRDPLELDDTYADILKAAHEKAEQQLADHPRNGGFGFCHDFWDCKKQILKEEYGLRWQTPAERNRDILFD